MQSHAKIQDLNKHSFIQIFVKQIYMTFPGFSWPYENLQLVGFRHRFLSIRVTFKCSNILMILKNAGYCDFIHIGVCEITILCHNMSNFISQ